MSQENKPPKFALCLEKKPSASKTSKRHVVSGLPFFFKCNNSIGGLKIYYDKPPYPYIHAVPFWNIDPKNKCSLEQITKRSADWIVENFSAIVGILKKLDSFIQINEDLYRDSLKVEKETEKAFDCQTCSERKIIGNENYCRLGLKNENIPSEIALCSRIKHCNYYRKIKSLPKR